MSYKEMEEFMGNENRERLALRMQPEQIGIDGDLTKIQTDAEYLVWYHKIVFLCAALGPFHVSSASQTEVLCTTEYP